MNERRLFGILVFALSACATDDQTPLGTVRQSILQGSASDESQDATVMLVHQKPGASEHGICTAALVAPRLVLTARHCVATTDEDIACDADGTPLIGGKVAANHDAANLFVFTGKNRPELDPSRWKPSGQGLEIIEDKSSTLCNHDLALVLLKEPISNVPLASLRLDGEVGKGEKLLTVGWGVASGEVEPSQRRQRKDVVITRVGPDASIPILTKSEFLFDESICLGDSGGPIFSQETGAIVGVVSRGGNGADPSKGGPASTCLDADNIGTKVTPFRELIMDGFARAGAQPQLEPLPDDDSCSAAPIGMRGHEGTRLATGLVGLLGVLVARRRGRGRA